MRLQANENVPGDAVDALRRAGHDVTWIREGSPGLSDPDVLHLAVQEQRVLITFDKDFGELAFRAGLPATCGVILFRIPMTSALAIANFIVAAVNSRSDWVGQFTVINEQRIRMRPLP